MLENRRDNQRLNAEAPAIRGRLDIGRGRLPWVLWLAALLPFAVRATAQQTTGNSDLRPHTTIADRTICGSANTDSAENTQPAPAAAAGEIPVRARNKQSGRFDPACYVQIFE